MFLSVLQTRQALALSFMEQLIFKCKLYLRSICDSSVACSNFGALFSKLLRVSIWYMQQLWK